MSCFSSNFCFEVFVVVPFILMLLALILVALISLSLLFLMYFSSAGINSLTLSSMLASPFRSSFLDTYSPSLLSLECKALSIVHFLVLWSICLSSSLVHFKKSPEYFTLETTRLFIPLIRFQLPSLISSCFLVRLRYSLLLFFLSFPLDSSSNHQFL